MNRSQIGNAHSSSVKAAGDLRHHYKHPGNTMRYFLGLIVLALWLTSSAGLHAAAITDLLGKWRWQSFNIDVWECRAGAVCAKVVSGPENVGLQIFASALVAKGNDLFGQVVDPKTKRTYRTRFRKVSRNKWRLDGCTPRRVCITGTFLRVK